MVCDAVVECDEVPLIAQLNVNCLQCLIANDNGSSGVPPIEPCLSDGVEYVPPPPAPNASEPWNPDMGCAEVDPVCVESDLGLMQGADFESLTPGCQCCFMSPGDDPFVDPFALCLGPLGPQVDFCASPGNAVSNPDANHYRCLHMCENWDASQDELEAAGCSIPYPQRDVHLIAAPSS